MLSPVESTAAFCLGPVTVDVESNSPEVLQWLTAFLVPSVQATDIGRGDVSIRFTCSGEAYDVLDRDGYDVTEVQQIPLVALDRKIISRPGWHIGGVTVVADRDRECFYRIDRAQVDVIARRDTQRARYGLMRVVREALTTRWLVRGGVLDLHAAACEIGGRAVLIAGPKRSGKTTLLCHALSSGIARVMANDRVFVDMASAHPMVHGIPSIVAIRDDSHRLIPMLEGSAALTPARLADRFQTSVSANAPLAAIVFPEIAPDIETWDVQPMSRAPRLQALSGSVFGMHRVLGTRTIFEDVAGPPAEQHTRDTMIERLADGTTIVQCRLGPQAYATAARELLHAIG